MWRNPKKKGGGSLAQLSLSLLSSARALHHPPHFHAFPSQNTSLVNLFGKYSFSRCCPLPTSPPLSSFPASYPPSFPPSLPPSIPPSLPPQVPPSFNPSVPPSLPPSLPHTLPPPFLPPSFFPTCFPPSVVPIPQHQPCRLKH